GGAAGRRWARARGPGGRGRARPSPKGRVREDPAQPQPSSEQNPPSFQIEKVYVKDLSLEIPNAPQVFVQQAQPQLEVQIQTNAAQFAEGYYERSVTATVTAKASDRTQFLANLVQPAIFSPRNVPTPHI